MTVKKIESKDVQRIIDSFLGDKPKTQKIPSGDYVFSLLSDLEIDLNDALQDPIIWQECVLSAKDRVNSIRKSLKGEI